MQIDLKKHFEALRTLPKPKAIIFDWDNTLVNTWPLIHTAIDETMLKMGKESWGLKKVRDNVHKSMRESFPEIFGEEWQAAGEIYKNSYRSNHLIKLEFLPNAIELLEAISKNNILQFVISNKMGPTLRQELKHLGIDKYFFSIIGASDALSDKPSKEPVELALIGSELDIKEDVIWFVGDTITDLSCAVNSNILPVIIGHFDEENVKSVSATISKNDLILKNYKEKNKFLNSSDYIVPIYFDHKELIDVVNSY